jgi:hypothetical protein
MSIIWDRVLLAQSILNSKSRGLRTFFVNVACSLGKRVSELEVKEPHPSPTLTATQELIPHSEQDAEVETRLLRLETRMDGSPLVD